MQQLALHVTCCGGALCQRKNTCSSTQKAENHRARNTPGDQGVHCFDFVLQKGIID